jgi:hypothetical protein
MIIYFSSAKYALHISAESVRSLSGFEEISMTVLTCSFNDRDWPTAIHSPYSSGVAFASCTLEIRYIDQSLLIAIFDHSCLQAFTNLQVTFH